MCKPNPKTPEPSAEAQDSGGSRASSCSAIPPLSFEDAERCARHCDYGNEAIEPKGNEINWADATGFFLEGYERARRIANTNLNHCVDALEFIAFNNHPCWRDKDRRYRALETLKAIGTHVRVTPNVQALPQGGAKKGNDEH